MNTDNPATPYEGTYWVVPGVLLAGTYPGGPDLQSTEKRLGALLEAGVHSVINLMAEEEVLEHAPGELYLPYEDILERLGEKTGVVVEIARYAIEDGNTLAEKEMELILDAIDAEIDGRDSPTLVHCSNGNGRTGMVIGCYLARHAIAQGKEALAKIKELRANDALLSKQKSPETMVEERFVLRWKEAR